MLELPREKFFGHTILIKAQPELMELMQVARSDLKRVGLEDPEFTKQYSVFTTDQVEARYLLDPVMMEKIINLHMSCMANSYAMSVIGKQVFIMIGREVDLFEPPPIETEATDYTFAIRLKRELDHILALIDYLDVYSPAKS